MGFGEAGLSYGLLLGQHNGALASTQCTLYKRAPEAAPKHIKTQTDLLQKKESRHWFFLCVGPVCVLQYCPRNHHNEERSISHPPLPPVRWCACISRLTQELELTGPSQHHQWVVTLHQFGKAACPEAGTMHLTAAFPAGLQRSLHRPIGTNACRTLLCSDAKTTAKNISDKHGNESQVS